MINYQELQDFLDELKSEFIDPYIYWDESKALKIEEIKELLFRLSELEK